DLGHVLNDTCKVYEALAPGGLLVWHDFNSPVAWVQVRPALERAGLAEAVYHVEGTQVAILHKAPAADTNGARPAARPATPSPASSAAPGRGVRVVREGS